MTKLRLVTYRELSKVAEKGGFKKVFPRHELEKDNPKG